MEIQTKAEWKKKRKTGYARLGEAEVHTQSEQESNVQSSRVITKHTRRRAQKKKKMSARSK